MKSALVNLHHRLHPVIKNTWGTKVGDWAPIVKSKDFIVALKLNQRWGTCFSWPYHRTPMADIKVSIQTQINLECLKAFDSILHKISVHK